MNLSINPRAFGVCALVSLLVSQAAAAQQAPVTAAPAQSQRALQQFDRAARQRIADSAAVVYAARYPELSKAQLLADSMRAWGRSDRWRDATTGDALATALQRDARSLVQDLHLWYRYEPGIEYTRDSAAASSASGSTRAVAAAPASGGAQMVRRTARIDPRDSVELARGNFGISRAEILAGNIGLLRIDQFVPLDWSRGAITSALQLLQHTDALVIDVRANRGGSPDLVAFIVSQFLPPAPQPLWASYHRSSGRSDTLWSVAELPTPRRVGRPLYILTDRRSGSAAEMLPYIAKMQGIATIVGERTAGAGTGGVTFSLGNGITMFSPERAPLIGPGWEATGVAPHVEVASADALTRALELIRAR